MTEFTPLESLLGGALLGFAALMLLFFNGRIAGISGILGGFLQFNASDTLWRFAFVSGLIAGGLVLLVTHPSSLTISLDYSMVTVVLAGLLVGIGSRMGNGCTSGHGVCGIGRLSPRSIAAVAVFMATGAASATLIAIVRG